MTQQLEKRPPSEERSRLWQISFGQKGEIQGLPRDVSRRDVIIFLDKKNQWWAANPPPELLKEIKMWRNDW